MAEKRPDRRDESRVDRVAMPSLRTDGTPDQTEGFVVIGEPTVEPKRAKGGPRGEKAVASPAGETR